METRIYVGNLNKSTTQDEIKTLFGQAGTVTSVDIATEKGTSMSKGFAFVSMPTQAEADKAISTLKDYALAENKLKVILPNRVIYKPATRTMNHCTLVPPGTRVLF